MPSVQFGTSSYKRSRGDMPPLPVVNMFAEEAPTEETGIALQSRPGLSDTSVEMGLSVEALFRRDGVLSGGLFGVGSGEIYSGSTSLGTLAGNGPVSIAGNEMGIMAAAGSTLRYYDGTTLSSVSFPDGASVRKVIQGASRFIAIRDGTGKFYWTSSLGVTFGALDFATAESAADALYDALFIDAILVLFGAETVEFWPVTGNSDRPFAPLQARVIERGIRATGCATAIGSTFAWVTNLNQICLTDENTVISNPGLEARIAASSECRLFSFHMEGTEFLAVRIDDETQVWTQRSQRWSEFQSYGKDNWLPQCFADGVFGSSDGKLLEFGDDNLDLGGVMERRFAFGMPLNSGGVTIRNIQLRCNVGQTPYLTGDYTDPTVEMRLSRNAGKTWGNWKQKALGVQGDYRKLVRWNGCGMASRPGLMGEFRVVDPIDFRVSDVRVNEGWGGR